MSWPTSDIPEVYKGERPTLLEADLANEVIGALNQLARITIEGSDSDKVEYDGYGVNIYYQKPSQDFDFTGDVVLLDSTDITQQYRITFESGQITAVVQEASPYQLRTIDICSGGSTESVDFVVKA